MRWKTVTSFSVLPTILVLLFSHVSYGQVCNPNLMVTTLYTQILEREPEPGGLSSWSSAFSKGLPLREAVRIIATSEEYQQNVFASPAVDAIYLQILGRPADANGKVGWISGLRRGDFTVRTLIENIAKTPEFKERILASRSIQEGVTELYRRILVREPDPVGLESWINKVISSGYDIVISDILHSAEYQSRFGDFGVPGADYVVRNAVTISYRRLLGREPDPTGLSGHIELLKTSGLIPVINNIVGSPEYSQKFGSNRVPGTTVTLASCPPHLHHQQHPRTPFATIV